MRILAFIFVILSAFFGPLWFAVCVGTVFALIWTGYELIFLGIFTDSIFGHTSLEEFPMYTFSFVLVAVCLAIIKPFIMLYDNTP